MILGVLALDGQSRGDSIAHRLEAMCKGRVVLSFRTLYPVLHQLEHEELVSVEWRQSEDNRRVMCYALTSAGRQRLAREARAWHDTTDVVGELLALLESQ
jgi:PadR family transcriptional regulator, regulatory protein PadR